MATYLGLMGVLGLSLVVRGLSLRFARMRRGDGTGPSGNPPVVILDYNATRDQFALHYDPNRTDRPDISVNRMPGHAGMAEIRLNRQVIAYVTNAAALQQQDIVMIPAPYCAQL